VKAANWFGEKFKDVVEAIKAPFKKLKEWAQGIWNGIKSVFSPNKTMFNKAELEAIIEAQTGQKIKFASGGLVNEGQMFIAREAGPELVGTIGNRTAVMNNDQIVDSVAQGVADANSAQNALLREEIAILRQILAKSSGNSGGVDIVTALSRRNRRDGKTVVSVGV
jgi:hypothetical protein